MDVVSRMTRAWDEGLVPLFVRTRGGAVETVHRGVVVLADARGRLLGSAGNPDTLIPLRSTAKPFQAFALVRSGAVEALRISQRELAVICGSHAGEKEHVQLVAALLARLGLSEEDLACGAHPPFSREARREIEATGGKPSSLHNNCSGKHAGMLVLARFLGESPVGYNQPDHPVQRRVAAEIASLLGLEPKEVFLGTDRCSVPVVCLPARQAATLYAQLAEGADPALARIRDAMLAHPQLVAGKRRFDTRAMEALSGRAVFKVGAAGVQGMALAPGAAGRSAVGTVIKIEDGSAEPTAAVVAAVLGALGQPQAAEAILDGASVIHTLRGEAVGAAHCLIGEGELLRLFPG